MDEEKNQVRTNWTEILSVQQTADERLSFAVGYSSTRLQLKTLVSMALANTYKGGPRNSDHDI